ncbi:26S proteasome subunit P45 family [Methanohalobium evestigatum Z-7303]|uniref:Proteasome-activating nucleotidase n=1 Tax=Methanohalobium evestigatum (strain ATCC BAA-1072 / DSM 3721 / NBRC 107634 / OCM 161 / Z-7303) TaxID=644295 RepID=D7E632_METEZ|nr:proteasome-activating nucleotidase [Methanohalobium evestigatum]ADI73054.1 26S proteasome subunit P45 family [Methanohalobium evestigatum Z-7303]
MSETTNEDIDENKYEITEENMNENNYKYNINKDRFDENENSYEYLADNEGDFSKYLLDRMKQLEHRNSRLNEQYNQIESEKRYVENQKLKYEREVRKLQAEIDRLKSSPLIIGTVMDVLDNGKLMVRSSTGPQFMVSMSKYLEDEEIEPGTTVALNQQTFAVVDVVQSTEEPMVSAMEVIESQQVDYDQIGGLDEQIKEIIESVEYPLTKPESFARIGISAPKGILLAGPPGTGKTLLAKAVAHRTDASFIRVVGSELVQKYIGEGAKLVREVFEMARKKAPSIVFIDELDAIAAKRLNDTNGADREVQRTLMQLLAEMDGFDERGDVRIIAATNRSDVLDPAILRPGRFDRVITVPMPDVESRENILQIHTRNMAVSDNIDFKKLANLTEGASGADLSAIAMEAGMLAVRNDKGSVETDDFLKAVDKVMNSGNESIEIQPEGMFG